METTWHRLTAWLYSHYFHFFDIPHFIPKELLKKLIEYWNKLFEARDELAEIEEAKDSLLDSLNIALIISALDDLIAEKNAADEVFKAILQNYDAVNSELNSQYNNIEDSLQNIVDWQEEYGWLT